MTKRDFFVWCFAMFVFFVMFGFLAWSANGAEPIDGVIVQERVINLPQDQDKWYLSVVGKKGETRYEVILRWFNSDKNLMKLKDQVHFREVESSTVVYNERYKSNVDGLPTIRVQRATGKVIYEACGSNIPATASGLYGAIANSVNASQGQYLSAPFRIRPCPCPQPQPDPKPQPLNDGGTPEMEETVSSFDTGAAGIGAGVALLCFFSGCGVSLFSLWREAYGQK